MLKIMQLHCRSISKAFGFCILKPHVLAHCISSAFQKHSRLPFLRVLHTECIPKACHFSYSPSAAFWVHSSPVLTDILILLVNCTSDIDIFRMLLYDVLCFLNPFFNVEQSTRKKIIQEVNTMLIQEEKNSTKKNIFKSFNSCFSSGPGGSEELSGLCPHARATWLFGTYYIMLYYV